MNEADIVSFCFAGRRKYPVQKTHRKYLLMCDNAVVFLSKSDFLAQKTVILRTRICPVVRGGYHAELPGMRK
jgi:hypothetical protein